MCFYNGPHALTNEKIMYHNSKANKVIIDWFKPVTLVVSECDIQAHILFVNVDGPLNVHGPLLIHFIIT